MTVVSELRPRALARAREREFTHAVGMVVALSSWGMMFACFFFVYFGLRAQALAWPPPGLPRLPLLLPTINTMVIVGSSLTLVRALKEMRAGHNRLASRWMGITLGLGLLFVALQCLLWRNMWLDGITVHIGTLGTVFYGLTVLHALHVAAGVVVLAYLLVCALRAASPVGDATAFFGSSLAGSQQIIRLRMCGMFWHFVDAIWLVMFVGLFLF